MSKRPSNEQLAEFRKLDGEARIKALKGTKLERVFQVQRDTIDESKRTVWLSIASEEPYERWWGIEILDVRKQSIRDARLRLGAPLLVGHDTADQVGVVEDFEITSDSKLRVLARFGRSARAEEIWRDVLDGIRRNTSVGYIIHDLILEKQEEDVLTYRVTDWEPLEGSLVAVPADPTVGVGRAAEPPAPVPQPIKERTMEKTKEQLEQEAAAATKKAVEEAVQREQKRVTDLTNAGEEYAAHGGREVAAALVKDANGSIEKFREQMLAKMATKTPKTPTAGPAERPAQYGDGARHIIRRGQSLKAFTQPVRFSDGTSMDPLEAAYRSGQWLLATVGQNVRAAQWCRDHGVDIQLRVMTTDVDTAGGYTVPDEMEQSVIDLREAYGLARRLTRRRPVSSDTKSIPKRVSGLTAYFINEDNAGITASDKGWGNVNLVAKTLAALSIISKNLEEDSIIDIVDDLAGEMAYAFALKEDQCWLIGDGTSTYGGMQGIITLMEATAYASRVAATTGHDTFAEIDNVDVTMVMGSVADFAGINPVWLSSKLYSYVALNRLKAIAGGNNAQVLEGGRPRDQYLGYDLFTSEIMPKVLTTLQNKVIALFGDFKLSSSFGDRRGIEVQVLRERYAEKLQIGILASERFQIVNHDLGSTTVKGPVAALYGA